MDKRHNAVVLIRSSTTYTNAYVVCIHSINIVLNTFKSTSKNTIINYKVLYLRSHLLLFYLLPVFRAKTRKFAKREKISFKISWRAVLNDVCS